MIASVVAEADKGVAVLRCSCCGLPWAEIQNGCLVIKARHHGQEHINVLSLAQLAKLLSDRGQ